MNEKAINQVITDYAVEVANLRIILATTQQELKELKEKEDKIEE